MVIDQQTDPATPFDVETKSNSSTRHGGGLLDARVRSASLQRETDFPLRHEQMHARPDGTEAEGKERTNNDGSLCLVRRSSCRSWRLSPRKDRSALSGHTSSCHIHRSWVQCAVLGEKILSPCLLQGSDVLQSVAKVRRLSLQSSISWTPSGPPLCNLVSRDVKTPLAFMPPTTACPPLPCLAQAVHLSGQGGRFPRTLETVLVPPVRNQAGGLRRRFLGGLDGYSSATLTTAHGYNHSPEQVSVASPVEF